MSNCVTKSQEFLNALSTKEKEFFISSLCTLAGIDGKIKPEELEFLEETAHNIGLELQPAYFEYSEEFCITEASHNKNNRLSLELLKYMFALAYTDSEFAEEEGHFISSLAEALNIAPQKASEISSWVIDRIIWLEQGDLIFSE
jgi:hypothetical protein